MLPLLPNIKVIEISNTIAASYAGRLLADIGAEVISIEPPGGNTLRVSTGQVENFANFLSANKRSATIDFATYNDGELARSMAAKADIILYDASIPYFNLHWLEQHAFNSHPTALTVISPFGLVSPYRDLYADELFLFSLSGIASVTPEEPEDRASERPMQLYGHQAQFVGGLVAAVSAMQGWFYAQRNQRPVLLDVAILDALTSVPITSQAAVFAGHPPPPGPSLRPRTVPRGFLKCSDGYIYTQGGDDNWPGWTRLLGRAEWLEPPFSEPSHREANWTALNKEIQAWLDERTMADVYRGCQDQAIVAFPVHSVSDVVQSGQANAREIFQSIHRSGSTESFVAPRTPIRILEPFLAAEPDSVRRLGQDTAEVVASLGTSESTSPYTGLNWPWKEG